MKLCDILIDVRTYISISAYTIRYTMCVVHCTSYIMRCILGTTISSAYRNIQCHLGAYDWLRNIIIHAADDFDFYAIYTLKQSKWCVMNSCNVTMCFVHYKRIYLDNHYCRITWKQRSTQYVHRYTVHSTVYTVHCTLYTVHCTVYMCTLYSVQCTLNTLYCTVHTVYYTA